MSQGLSVFLVPRQELLAAIGSRDGELLADLVDHFTEDIEYLDSNFETDNPDEWDGPTAAAAIAELIDGRPSMVEDTAGLYTAVFELFCRCFGEWASNDYFSPCRASWFERLDTVLKDGGVPLSLVALWSRSPPMPIPIGQLLDFGHWSPEMMRAAVGPLARLLPTVADDEERAALGTVLGWLRTAASAPESILVGFFS